MAVQLRECRNGQLARSVALYPFPRIKPKAKALTEDEKLIRSCLKVVEQRGFSPFFVAWQERDNWTLEQWNAAREAYAQAKLERRIYL